MEARREGDTVSAEEDSEIREESCNPEERDWREKIVLKRTNKAPDFSGRSFV